MEEQAAAAAASAAADFVARSAASAPSPTSSDSPSDSPPDGPSDSRLGNGVLVTRHHSLEPPLDAVEVAAKAKSFGANRIRSSSGSLPSDRALSASLPDSSCTLTDKPAGGSDRPSDKSSDDQQVAENSPDTAASHNSKQTSAADGLLADRNDSSRALGQTTSDSQTVSDTQLSDARPRVSDGRPKFNFGGVKFAIQKDDQVDVDEHD